MLSNDVNIQHEVVLQLGGSRQHLTKYYRGCLACWARRMTHPLNIQGCDFFFEHLKDYYIPRMIGLLFNSNVILNQISAVV